MGLLMDSRYRRAQTIYSKTGGAVIKSQVLASETKALNLKEKYNKYVIQENTWSSDEYSDGDYFDDFCVTRYKPKKYTKQIKPKAQFLDFFPNGVLPTTLTDQISNLLSSFGLVVDKTSKFVDTARKIMSMCIKLATCHCAKWASSIVAFQLTDYLVSFGIPTIDVNEIIELIKGFWKPQAQMLTDFIFNNVASVATISFILLSTLFSNALPSYANLKTVAGDASVFGRACAGGLAIHKVLSMAMEFALDKYFLYVHGVPRDIKGADELITGCAEFYLEVQALVALDNLDKCTDLIYARRVESAHRSGLALVSKTQNSVYGKDVFPAVKTHFDTISRLYNRVMTSGVLGDGSRLEPVVFYIHGKPGVGKSTTTYVLAKELLHAEQEDLADNLEKNLYNRRVEQEFWDGYANQPICIFDDFGQMTDTQAKPNKEYYEIIRTSNISAYPLHMASIADKNSTFFNSKAVVINCNSAHYNIPSLTCPDAFERRVYPKIEQMVKPEFGVLYADSNGKTYYRLNKPFIREYNKAKGINSSYTMDSAIFKIQDIKETMDWPTFCKWSRDKYIQTRDDSLEFKTFLKNYKPVAQGDFKVSDWWNSSDQSDKPVLTKSFGEEVMDLHDMGIDLESVTEEPDIKLIVADKQMSYSEKIGFLNLSFPTFSRSDLLEKLVTYSNTISSNTIYYLKKAVEFSKLKYEDLKKVISEFDFAPYLTVYNVLLAILLIMATWLCSHTFRRQGGTGDERKAESRAIVDGNKVRINTESRSVEDKVKFRNVTESRVLEDKSKARSVTESRVLDDKSKSRNVTESECKAQSVLLEIENADAQALSDMNANEIISHKILKNTFAITFIEGEIERATFIGTILKGRVMLVPSHCKMMLATCSHMKIVSALSVAGSHEYQIDLNTVKLHEVYNRCGEFKDTSLFVFDRDFPQYPDITKYFVDSNNLSKFDSTAMTMISLRTCGTTMVPILHKSTAHSKHHVGSLSYDLETKHSVQELRLRDYYSYSLETKSGDCGGLVIALNPAVGRKIIGMHVAGNPGVGYATSVSIEDLNRTLMEVDKTAQLLIEDQVGDCGVLPKGHFYGLGKISKCMSGSTTTKLRPSPLHGKVSETKTTPAHLGPVKVGDKVIHPLTKGLEKAGLNTPLLDKDTITVAANHYTKSVVGGDAVRGLLTYEEAVRGIPEEEFVDAINRKSSPGYPWMNDNDPTGGKYKWFGKEDILDVSNKEVKQAVLERIEKAKKGIRTKTYWVDTLKDERRPIEKVKAGKTRVFSNGPMDFTIAVRMYFGRFNQHYMKNRIDNDSAVGTNPFGYDWTRIVKKVTKVGSKVIAGDFANYDGCMWTPIMYACLDIIQEFYDDSDENKLVRQVLFVELVNSWHIYKDNVYMWTHSNPSGNPLTVILNSMYGAIAVRMVYLDVTGLSIDTFDTNVSMLDYGDDNLINISDSVIDIFNQDTITTGFARIGMTYTDEGKSGVWEKYRSLNDVKFLKRAFRFEQETNTWVSPLELDVILDMLNWVRGDHDHHALCSTNVETAFRELSLHGEDTFNEYTTKIYKEAKSLDIVPALYSRRHYLMEPLEKW